MLLVFLALLLFNSQNNSRRELTIEPALPIHHVVIMSVCYFFFRFCSCNIMNSALPSHSAPTEMVGWILLYIKFYRDQPIATWKLFSSISVTLPRLKNTTPQEKFTEWISNRVNSLEGSVCQNSPPASDWLPMWIIKRKLSHGNQLAFLNWSKSVTITGKAMFIWCPCDPP